jgi:hypothetical protein
VKIQPLMFAALIALLSTSLSAADPKEIERRVTELNAQSVKLFGVSLTALRYLTNADANSYLHLGHLEKSGEITFIRELEAKGYVRTQVMQALPDGSQRHETFLRVMPIGDGVAVQRSIMRLQHNSPSQPTR